MTKENNEILLKEKPMRESGLELLRIIAMLLIVLHHCMLFSPMPQSSITIVRISKFLKGGGKLGVNIFILISSYFLIDKSFKFSRLLNIILQTFFYSLVCYLIFITLNKTTFSLDSFVQNFFPILYKRYWFVTAYIFLLLLSPLLNKFIKSLTKKQHFLILLISLTITVFFPYINYLITKKFIEIPFFNEIIWFTELYFFTSYIKLHNIKIDKFFIILPLVLGIIIKSLFIVYCTTREIYMVNSLGNIIVSISLFLLFKEIKFKSKIINTISSTMFGVYLIHENPYIRNWWWKFSTKIGLNLINNFIVVCLINTLITFFVCLIIEFIRILLLQKTINKSLSYLDKQKIQDQCLSEKKEVI